MLTDSDPCTEHLLGMPGYAAPDVYGAGTLAWQGYLIGLFQDSMGDAVHRYIKGARSERELLNTLYGRGYSVIRSAGSGVNALGPDIIALKDREAFCIECKAWDKSSLSLDYEQFEKLLEWERNTSFPTFIAWKISRDGWYFIRLDEFKKCEKSYTVTMKKTLEIGRRLDTVLGEGKFTVVQRTQETVNAVEEVSRLL